MGKYKVEISGVDTSNLKNYNQEEMKQLFIKYQEGDLFARDMLIEGNLKLVLSILKKFYNKYDNLDDLFQIGCVGLIKAIDNFDLSYDVKFSTYAVPMILGEVKRYIRDDNSIRISRSLKDIGYKSLKIIDDYYSKNGHKPSINYISSNYSKNGHKPSINYISSILNVTEFEVSNALLSLKTPVSMYEAIYNDGGDTIYLYDQIEDKKIDNDFSHKIEVENAINDLNEREKYILDQRYVIGKSQMEIAEEINISQAQVSRLEKKAIKQLKKVLK